MTGDYIRDTLLIGNTNTVIKNMIMGLATQFTGPAGIMGIGYDAGGSNTSAGPGYIYPGLVGQLQAQGFINTLAYSLWLNDLDSPTGSILFGGIDRAKFQDRLVVLPVQSSSNDSYPDFSVTLSSLSLVDATRKTAFSQTNLALPVVLTCGDPATYLPDSIVNPIISGVGATNDADFGPVVPCALNSSQANFSFGFGGSGGLAITVPIGES